MDILARIFTAETPEQARAILEEVRVYQETNTTNWLEVAVNAEALYMLATTDRPTTKSFGDPGNTQGQEGRVLVGDHANYTPAYVARLREIVVSIPAPARSELLRVLVIHDDAERAREIGELHRRGLLPASSELLYVHEEDSALRAVLVGMLREQP